MDLTRVLKKLGYMQVTMVKIEVAALGTVAKNLEGRLEQLVIRSKTIQTTALLKSVEIIRRVLVCSIQTPKNW